MMQLPNGVQNDWDMLNKITEERNFADKKELYVEEDFWLCETDKNVSMPWAIYNGFFVKNDIQFVAEIEVRQDTNTYASVRRVEDENNWEVKIQCPPAYDDIEQIDEIKQWCVDTVAKY